MVDKYNSLLPVTKNFLKFSTKTLYNLHNIVHSVNVKLKTKKTMTVQNDLLKAISLFHNKQIKNISVNKNNQLQVCESFSLYDLFEYQLLDFLPSDITCQQWISKEIEDFRFLGQVYLTKDFSQLTSFFLSEYKSKYYDWENGFVIDGSHIYAISEKILAQVELPYHRSVKLSIPYRIFKILETLKVKEFAVFRDDATNLNYIYTDRLKLRYSQDSLSTRHVKIIKEMFQDFCKKANETNLEITRSVKKKEIDEIASKIKLNKQDTFLRLEKEAEKYRVYM